MSSYTAQLLTCKNDSAVTHTPSIHSNPLGIELNSRFELIYERSHNKVHKKNRLLYKYSILSNRTTNLVK